MKVKYKMRGNDVTHEVVHLSPTEVVDFLQLCNIGNRVETYTVTSDEGQEIVVAEELQKEGE